MPQLLEVKSLQRLAAMLVCTLLCEACRTEPPEDEVPETSAARARLKQLSERPGLSWLEQSSVRFSRSGSRITAAMPREAASALTAIELPTTATGFTRVTETRSGMTIHQRLERGQPVSVESANGLLVYRGALDGFDYVQRPSATHVEDFVTFTTRPSAPRVAYEVELAQGVAGLRLVEGVLEFLDASGDPRLRVGPGHILDAANRWHDVRAEIEGCAVDRNPVAPWGRPVLPAGASTCRVVFSWEDSDGFYPAVFDPTWSTTIGTMASRRSGILGVLLSSGQVLVAGGLSAYNVAVASAELYNEQTGTWAITGSMATARHSYGMSYTTRGSPRVVVAGGSNVTTDLNSVEWYNPSTGTWSAAGNVMNFAAFFPQAVTLADGRVAIIGGQYYNPNGGCLERSRYTYVYDPLTTGVTTLAFLSEGRILHSATALPDGRVFVAGGVGSCCSASCGDLLSTEILTTSNTWVRGPSLQVPRTYHAATLLSDQNRVLLAGGQNSATSEIYTLSTGTMSTLRSMGTSVPLATAVMNSFSDGRVLFSGGYFTSPSSGSSNLALIYNPSTNTWSTDNPLTSPRRGHAQVLMASGRMLIAGGAIGGDNSAATVLNTSEISDALPNGSACTGDGVCASKLCVDGVCCNTACTGSCNACNLSSARGTCTNVPITTPGAPACANHLVCDGTSGSCPTACTSDQTCESGYYCVSGTCQPKQPNGQPCSATNQCQSTLCIDGVCCNTACLGSCNACNRAGSVGTCTNVPIGTTGAPACANHLVCDGTSGSCPSACISDAVCESGYYCVSGTCQPKQPNGQPCSATNQCQSNLCVDGVCCNTACTGSCNACNRTGSVGTCTNVPVSTPGAPACANHLVCDGTSGSCPSACTSDAVCEGGYYCASGTCQPKKPNGQTCSATNQCLSSFCVDGVCCNNACTGSCNACNRTGSVGTCTNVPITTPGAPACANHLVCDGTSGSCPLTCTSDATCESGYYCASGTCRPKQSNGQPCNDATQCQSSLCVDGVCCNTACGNACDSCNVGGSTGTCTNVPAGTASSCGTYLCDGLGPTCPATCTQDQQCAAPAVCLNGQCRIPTTIGQPCTQSNECASGFCADGVCCNSGCAGSCDVCNAPGSAGTCTVQTSGSPGTPACAPYVCDGTGASCPTGCTADTQCADGATCQDGSCTTDPRGHIGWSCGCDTSSEGSAFLALILLGLLALRRSEVRP